MHHQPGTATLQVSFNEDMVDGPAKQQVFREQPLLLFSLCDEQVEMRSQKTTVHHCWADVINFWACIAHSLGSTSQASGELDIVVSILQSGKLKLESTTWLRSLCW